MPDRSEPQEPTTMELLVNIELGEEHVRTIAEMAPEGALSFALEACADTLEKFASLIRSDAVQVTSGSSEARKGALVAIHLIADSAISEAQTLRAEASRRSDV